MQCVSDLCASLIANGHEAIVIAPAGRARHRLEERSTETYSIGSVRHLSDLVPFLHSYRQILNRLLPDIIHVHTRLPALLSRIAGWRPDVSTVHSQVLTDHRSRFDRGLVRRLITCWGRRVTVPDVMIKDMLLEAFRIQQERISIIPNAIDMRRFNIADHDTKVLAKRQLNVHHYGVIVSYVGRLVDYKRPYLAIQVLAEVQKAINADVALVIAGDGPLSQSLARFAHKKGVLSRCRFVGWCDPVVVYHASDLLLLPSEREGFALSAIEAMACGVPVVRTRTGGWRQQIVEGVTGWSTECDDKAFVERAATVTREIRSGIINCEAIRQHVEGRFSQDVVARQFIRLYQGIVAKRHSRHGLRY